MTKHPLHHRAADQARAEKRNLAHRGHRSPPATLCRPPDRLRQGYGGPPKLHAKAEGGRYPGKRTGSRIVPVLRIIPFMMAASIAATASAAAPDLRWAGDAEGGAPFVEADPSHPDELVGFDVDVA